MWGEVLGSVLGCGGDEGRCRERCGEVCWGMRKCGERCVGMEKCG